MRKLLFLLFVPCLALAFGCGKDTRPPDKPNIEGGLRKTFPVLDRTLTMEQMRNIDLGFKASPGAAPKTIEELEQVHGSPKITQAINDGAIVVILGVSPERQPGEAILAYQNHPDDKGERVVLTCGGEIKVMDEKTFQTAPKAKAR
jgi:hypothetical protein